MSDTFTWPEERVRSADVREWINSVLWAKAGSTVRVMGPTVVYRSNDWAVTARFEVQTDSADVLRGDKCPVDSTVKTDAVVCKVGFSPLFATSPAIYSALARCAPNNTPWLLTSHTCQDSQSSTNPQIWTLFAPFSGQTVRSLAVVEPVIEMARLIGRIQMTFAALPEVEKQGIPRTPLGDLPAHFDATLDTVHESYFLFWRENSERLGDKLDRVEAILTNERALEGYRKQVAVWTEELLRYRERGIWCESIDHVDLHTNNAVMLDREDDTSISVLIYDWDEASVGCPFFSLSNLLENARRLTPTTAYPDPAAAVRRAYLESLPWSQSQKEREAAFDLAMKIVPLQRLHYMRQFFQALNTSAVHVVGGGAIEEPVVVLEYLAEALAHWDAEGDL